MSIELLMLFNHLFLCHPLLLLSLISPSIRVFQLFTSGSQNIGASDSASVLSMSIQGLFPLELISLISLLPKGLSTVFTSITIWKHQFFGAVPSLWSNSHLYMTTKKTIALTIWIFIRKLISLLFNTLSSFLITFLPRSNCLLILWLESPGESTQLQIKRESHKYYLVLLCLSVAISCLVLSCFLAWASGKRSMNASFNGHICI